MILHGLRMEQEGNSSLPAVKLLEHWTGNEFPKPEEKGASLMTAWQKWFATTYPDRLEAILPSVPSGSRWNLETLVEYFNSNEGKSGNSEHGLAVYQKAKCSSCHRFGQNGKQIGPDLTAVAKRFTRKEVLESVLFPSHIISDQYAARRVLTASGTVHNGLVTRKSDGSLIVKDSDLREHVVAEEDIEEILPSKVSMMPSGLFDSLSAEEIRDLFAFMGFVPVQVAEKPKLPTVR